MPRDTELKKVDTQETKLLRRKSQEIEPTDQNPLARPAQRAFLQFLMLFMRCFFRIRYHGLENIPQSGPVVIVSNHQSFLDIPAILCKIKPWVHMLAKQELFSNRLFRWFFNRFGAIPVNRKKMELSTMKRVLKVLKRSGMIALFPEGTRVKRKLKPEDYVANPGAVYMAKKMHCPILPISIKRPYKLFRVNHVYIGESISLERLESKAQSADNEKMTYEMMKIVYALQGYDYGK